MSLKIKALIRIASITCFLTACGGGGGSSKEPQSNIPAPPVIPNISIADVAVTEGNEGTTEAVFTVTLSQATTNTVSVDYATSDDTAVAGEDYVAASGTLTFAAGSTSQQIEVTVYGDTLYSDDDPTEYFTLSLSNASNGNITSSSANGTIDNDDMSEAESTVQLRELIKSHSTSTGMWMHLLEIDLGGDDDADLVYLGAIDNTETKLREFSNLTYFVNNQGAGFKKYETNIKAFARDVEITDFNGDGLEDIFLADHGYDHPPFPGGHNTLIIQENNTLVDHSANVPITQEFWHSSSAIDIDNDGDMDLLVSALNTRIAVYINDGNANFTDSTGILPEEDLLALSANAEHGQIFYPWIESVDLDLDGYPELIAASSPNIPILRNVTGSYLLDNNFAIEQISTSGTDAIVGMKSIDYDLDGCTDLVHYTTDYNTYGSVNLFNGDCTGKLTHVAVLRDAPLKHQGSWTTSLHVADLNSDGYPDIYTSYYFLVDSSYTDAKAFINDGAGTYTEQAINPEMNIKLIDRIALGF